MIKRIAFVRRHPSLDVEELHDRWSGRHAELVAESPAATEHLLRYEQHRRTARDYERPDNPYDGVAIQWYESWDAFLAMRADPRHATIRQDFEDLFTASDVLEVFTGPEQVVIAGPEDRGTPITKLVCGVLHKPGMDLDEFHRYWWGDGPGEPRRDPRGRGALPRPGPSRLDAHRPGDRRPRPPIAPAPPWSAAWARRRRGGSR